MVGTGDFSVEGKTAVLATMHGKELVIKPLLEGGLRLKMRVPTLFDTDRFGTFSRDIERTGSQLDAARAKIAAAFEHDPEACVGIASEGSFGPHPFIPFVPLGREIVVMLDRETGLELIGHYADLSPNHRHETVTDVQAALAFAERVGFPDHGLIVIGTDGDQPLPSRLLRKTIETAAELSSAVEETLALCAVAHIETDMRAHRNPSRMRAIKRATVDLIRRYRSGCPQCNRPGYGIAERLLGLPCSWCGEPTDAIQAEVMVCAGCGHQTVLPVQTTTADPGRCNNCNP